MLYAIVNTGSDLDLVIIDNAGNAGVQGVSALTGGSSWTPIERVLHLTAPQPAMAFPWINDVRGYVDLPASLAANPRQRTGRGLSIAERARRERAEEVKALRSTVFTRAGTMRRTPPSTPEWSIVRPLRHEVYRTASEATVFMLGLFAICTVRTDTPSAERTFLNLAPIIMENFIEADGDPRAPVIPPYEVWRSLSRRGTPLVFYRNVQRYYSTGSWRSLWEAHQCCRGREARDYMARKLGLPNGLALIKASFALELLGHDVACIDTWMSRAIIAVQNPSLGPDEVYYRASRDQKALSKVPDNRRALPSTLKRYHEREDFLMETPFYRAGDATPLARAQWTWWSAIIQSIGREPAFHTPAFDIARASVDLMVPWVPEWQEDVDEMLAEAPELEERIRSGALIIANT